MLSLFFVTILVGFSAIFSGLNLALMSLDPAELKRKATLGNLNASKILPLRKKSNLLLVTLLVGNVAVNAAISLILGSITSGIVAGIAATILITLFGEIIPQAVFSRYAVLIGAKLTPLMWVLIWIFMPISWPIAKVLDKVLGDELPSLYSKAELVHILDEHHHNEDPKIDDHEVRIAQGALTFGDKRVGEIMTPRKDIQAIEVDAELTTAITDREDKFHSRILVYRKRLDKVVGIIFLRNLIGLEQPWPKVREVMDKGVHFVNEKDFLDDCLDEFFDNQSHLFVVKNKNGRVVGVISFEDVMEEILGKEIEDEHDV